jgi:hypothetical protein
MTSASTKRRHKRHASDDAFLPWDKRAARAETENQRLRAAMVHAMDDCEHLAKFPGAGLRERAALRAIAKSLKAALGKK